MERAAALLWQARPALVVVIGCTALLAFDLLVRVGKRLAVAALVTALAVATLMPDAVPGIEDAARRWFQPVAAARDRPAPGIWPFA